MNKSSKRIYSVYTQEAAQLLGYLIQVARKQKRMTATELSERAGISRGTLHKIERGSLSSELGLVFEVAMLVGVSLFNMDPQYLEYELSRMQEKLSLLPKRQYHSPKEVDDDF